MKKIAFLIFSISLGVANLHADDQIATVQQELKDQGFYYGQIDGQPGAETTAAIRRYQIRNGLQVSGTLTQETLDSLKGATTAGVVTPAPSSSLPPPPAPLDAQGQQPQAQQTPTPEQNISQSDREFLRKQNSASVQATPPPAPPAPPADNPNVVPPPVVVSQEQEESPQAPSLAVQYASLFARTPYQNAPFEVQQGTLRNAQAQLARETYYNGEVDGVPGPMTARAIAAFQADAGFAQTGRLDLNTLSALHLLPNSGPPVVQRRVIIQPFYPPPRYYVQPRVYRGNWVN
jgi:peptidoglycan hydrolase-like protein with peptidoglycan-binding domain